jgi:hypothetical protein
MDGRHILGYTLIALLVMLAAVRGFAILRRRREIRRRMQGRGKAATWAERQGPKQRPTLTRAASPFDPLSSPRQLSRLPPKENPRRSEG